MYIDKLIVFDLFGVVFTKGLSSSIDHLKGVFNKPEKEISKVYRKWEKEFDLGLIDEKGFWDRVNNELSTNISHKILSNIVISSYKIKPETILLAEYLKRDFPIAVFSNYRREWFNRLDKKYKISKIFDDLYISSDIELKKPSKEAFDYISSTHSIDKKNIYLIDDDIRNIKGINDWGGNGILFNNVYETEIKLRELIGNKYPIYDDYYSGVLLKTKSGSLIMQRRDNKKTIANPGKLSVFGGRREKNETALECAKRELKEETGITVDDNQFIPVGKYAYPIENNNWMLCSYYLLENINVNDIKIKEGKNIEIWKPLDAISQKDITTVPKLLIEKLIKEKKI
ncbi:MAG: NUDIX domain-containing protein [Chlorobi bacterium]|nr:NUDIX domain-containing protein [Chlorobiota bacterium]